MTHDQLAGEWRDLLARHARTTSALDRELSERHGLGMSEFEVLEQLAAVDTCRVQQLVGNVHLSQSALSRAVARLEADGLVERAICPEDRRGISVCLTDAGRARHAEARPTHRRVLEETL